MKKPSLKRKRPLAVVYELVNKLNRRDWKTQYEPLGVDVVVFCAVVSCFGKTGLLGSAISKRFFRGRRRNFFFGRCRSGCLENAGLDQYH
jgi:hypothetical protein